MKYVSLHTIFTLLIVTSFSGSCTVHADVPVIEYEFVSKKAGIKLLQEEDLHSQNWTEFDIQSRVGSTEATKEDLIQFISKQVLSWSYFEKRKINRAVQLFSRELQDESYTLPNLDTIQFVKTTGLEEGDAWAYTRGNHIVISDQAMEMDQESLAKLIAHELVHIITRKNPIWREEMYRVLGFAIGERIELPQHYDKYRISNPDTPFYDATIEYNIDGKKKRLLFVLLSDQPYSYGSFFDYVNIVLIEIDSITNEPMMHEGILSYYLLSEVPTLEAQLSENTDYILDPEEIVAENFVLAVFDDPQGQNSTQIKKLEKILKKLSQ